MCFRPQEPRKHPLRHPRHVCEASRRSVCWELSLTRFAISLHCMNPTKWPASCSTATPWHFMRHHFCALFVPLFQRFRYFSIKIYTRFEGVPLLATVLYALKGVSTASLVRGSRRYAQFWAVFLAELSPMKTTLVLWFGLRGYGIAEDCCMTLTGWSKRYHSSQVATTTTRKSHIHVAAAIRPQRWHNNWIASGNKHFTCDLVHGVPWWFWLIWSLYCCWC